MTKYIAILRGINVGGKRKILMADLRQLFTDLGFSDIVTYIQSGNVVFTSYDNKSIKSIEEIIQESIMRKFGFDVPVIIRSDVGLAEAFRNNPYYSEICDINNLFLTFLKEVPADEHVKNIEEYNFHPDKFEISGSNIYGYSSGKYSESKLTNNFFENKLKVSATTRNWKTVMKLSKLSG